MSWVILVRVILSVSANALQKRLLLDGRRIMAIWVATYALMLLPGAALAAASAWPRSTPFWANVLAGGFLDALGNLAMVAALRSTDLSVFGPLNAFRPVLALGFGWLLLQEVPTSAGLAGVGVTVAGALVLFSGDTIARGEGRAGEALRTLALRLLGLSLSTISAVFLKRAAVLGSAELTLAGWIVCGLLCLGVVSLVREPGSRKPLFGELRGPGGGWLVLHAAVFFVMQWLTIRIFQETLLAYSFAYFQLAMVLQVLLGWHFFREPHLIRRLLGCVVMGAGSGLMAWKG